MYPTHTGRKSLASKLGIDYDPINQDWEYAKSDPDRMVEYINLYRSNSTSDEEKISLMQMMIQSMEDISDTNNLSTNQINKNKYWIFIKSNLIKNNHLHKNDIEYWSLLDDLDTTDDSVELFFVTNSMRDLFNNINK